MSRGNPLSDESEIEFGAWCLSSAKRFVLTVTWNEWSRRRTFRLPWYCFLLIRLCLTNHSAVSIPHPTESAEIYAGCGIPGCCIVCWAVYTPLCGGRCAACLHCSFFLCCRQFVSSDVHDIILRNKRKNVRVHPSTLCTEYGPCLRCLGNVPVARGSPYSTRTRSNYLPLHGARVASILPPHGIVFDPYTHNN